MQSSVAAWVETTAPALPAGRPQVAPGHFATAEPPEVEVAVSLYAWPAKQPPGGGHLSVMRFGDDLDTMMRHRVARLQWALTGKLPKLLEHADSRTVLVLEDADLAMSNISDVWVALQAASDGLILCETIVVAESEVLGVPAHSAVIVLDDGEWLGDFNKNRFALPDALD